MVDNCEEILRMDSSRTEVCSGVEPCLDGSCARASFSTWIIVSARVCRRNGSVVSYSNLEVDKLLSKRGHFVVETESIFAEVICSEDKVALSLLFALRD